VVHQEPIGLVAGAGLLPRHFALKAKKSGIPIYLFAIKGSTHLKLSTLAEKTCWASAGQVGSLISFFKKNKVRKIAFHGKVQHGSFFRDVRLDWKGLTLWSRAKDKSGRGLLNTLGNNLKSEGLYVLDGRFLMGELLVQKGCLTRTRPSNKVSQIIKRGIHQARGLARLGIGQTLIFKDGAVAAVEAMEGTDEAITRAGKWAGKGTILIKTASTDQDWRFDVPTIGLSTLQKLCRVKSAGIVVEAGKTFLLEKEKTLRLADSEKIFILAV
jgi:hypothetical protein